jgi:hypothetical protein
MSYIGNQPTQIAFVSDLFTGNASTTVFTMSVAPANTASVLVAIFGVLQDPSTYSVSGTTLTFSAAPPSGTGNISVRYLGIPASGVTTTAYRTVTEFTATSGQVTFTPPSYTAGFITVYRNGVRLGSADVTASNGTTVTLATGATSGDLVTTESFYVSSVLNAIPNIAGSVVSSNIQTGVTLTTPNLGTPSALVLTNATGLPGGQLTGSQSIPKTVMPTGSVIQVVNFTTSGQVANSGTAATATGLTASITPTTSSSKILVISNPNISINGYNTINTVATVSLYKNGSSIMSQILRTYNYNYSSNNGLYVNLSQSLTYLDSPATTSSTTYAIYFTLSPGYSSYALSDGGSHSITLLEIAA